MNIAEFGDIVKVHYTGKMNNGEVFDTSDGKEPLEFQIGSGMVIEGFEEGIIGMKSGEKKSVNIPKEKGYGEYNPEYIIEVDRNNLPPDLNPIVGMGLEMSNPEGHPINVIITNVSDNSITLDANFFLAGKDLVFDLELVGILNSEN